MRALSVTRCFAVAVALAPMACASPVEDVWIDPSLEGRSPGFQKVATVAMFPEGAMRRVAEDELARAIEAGPGDVDAVPSYELIYESELTDAERVRSRLEAAGFDGVAVVSVVEKEQRITATPGVSMGWGTYGPGWRGAMFDAASLRSDTIVRVKTNLYEVDEGRLLWSGTTRTMNPRDVSDLIRDVVHDVGSALREEGLVQ